MKDYHIYRHPVEEGVPLPEAHPAGRKSGNAIWAYPFALMKVGSSFLVPAADLGSSGVQRINTAITNRSKKEGCWLEAYTYRQRTLKDDGEEGIRVWRIK